MAIGACIHGSRSRGFTMIEMLVTVAIVGIMASIAMPMYFDNVTRGKLIDGTTKLADFKIKMDKYFADNRTYLNGAACGVPNPVVTGADYFAVTCGAPGPPPTANTYVLWSSGIPAKGMALHRFVVDQTDAKSSTGPAGWLGSGVCWAMRKDGTC